MKRFAFPLSLVIPLILILGATVQTSRAARRSEPPKPQSATPAPRENQTGPVRQAIQDAMQTSQAKALVMQIYQQKVEDIRLSSDGEWARAWLVSIDPQTDEPAPCEPGLVLVHWDGDAWQVTLPADAGWADAVKAAPLNLLPQEAKDLQLETMQKALAEMPTSAFTGYYLPWQAGLTKYVSQTTYHDYYTPSGTAHYAFDFYVHEQIWDIMAAKPGIVWKYYDAVPTCYDLNCGQDLGNYLVVKDPTTNPVSYMLYLHLAQNSIPAALKHVGALVKQAQFIGKADNTGASWGDHLHFMVHTNPNSYWGQSVDIKFSDVTINGGRPRVLADKAYCNWPGDVCTTFQTDYISFNSPVKDNTIPTAGFSSPVNGDVIAARTVNLNGWGQDPQAGIFSLQVFVNYSGAWQGLNTVYFTNSLSYAWDWCSADVPNGPVSFGIQATDLAGHISAILGVRTVSKSFDCPITSAGIDLPTPGSEVTARQVTVSGWGVGADGLAQLQAMANIDGTWQNIGAASSTSPLTFQWDLCNAGVPDGPISLSFVATDLSGEKSPISDVHSFIKNFACPAPTPAANQVLICTGPDYSVCHAFGEGQYASGDSKHPMDPVADASAYSIRVGSNVQATLYDTKSYSERAVTYFADDPNMEDNFLRQDTMSSFKVQKRNVLPSAPELPAPSTSYQAGDVVTLYWENAGGATKYQVMLTGTLTMTTSLQALPYLHLEGLQAGEYGWKVRGQNENGYSDWSQPGSFTIAPALRPALGPLTSAPYNDDMETSDALWTRSGLWALGNASTGTTFVHSGSHAWWYQDQASGSYSTPTLPNSGDLTSPEITIPASGYSLRFWYFYDAETGYPYFDQRWVQISQDGGPFANVLQLSDDVQATWLQSPFIDLSAYTGHDIQVRFHFETLDKKYNADWGWGVDDFNITHTSPPVCSDANEPNDTPGKAVPIAYGATVPGQICPPGDVDYFSFTGAAGDVIGAGIDAQASGSSLDSVLSLLDSSGNLLTWNDDKIEHVLLDSQIYYRLPKNGVYYLKVIAWDHPSAGGSDDFYHLTLYKDPLLPQISLEFPLNAGVIPGSPFKVRANVSDAVSGVSHVDFMWHSGDWVNDSWNTLGSDWDGSDGWYVDFDASSMLGQQGLAFYARATDKAGNSVGVAAWNVSVIDDSTPPSLSMQALAPHMTSTAIQLQWTASDTQSGIDHFAVQVADNGGAWQDYQTEVASAERSLWYVGQQGHSYAFRMLAEDRAGNLRPYPSNAEATTTIPSMVCTALDAYEPDNPNAAFIQTNGMPQQHNFCSPPPGSPGLSDQDWIQFTPQAGGRYLILATPVDPSAAVNLTLLASNKTTILAQVTTDIFGKATMLTWKAASAVPVYVRMEHFNGAVAGSSVGYRVSVIKNYPVYFFPVMSR
jgi:murein DD-endopeptidase MepM/ murein hydrolase activator NlpD